MRTSTDTTALRLSIIGFLVGVWLGSVPCASVAANLTIYDQLGRGPFSLSPSPAPFINGVPTFFLGNDSMSVWINDLEMLDFIQTTPATFIVDFPNIADGYVAVTVYPQARIDLGHPGPVEIFNLIRAVNHYGPTPPPTHLLPSQPIDTGIKISGSPLQIVFAVPDDSSATFTLLVIGIAVLGCGTRYKLSTLNSGGPIASPFSC